MYELHIAWAISANTRPFLVGRTPFGPGPGWTGQIRFTAMMYQGVKPRWYDIADAAICLQARLRSSSNGYSKRVGRTRFLEKSSSSNGDKEYYKRGPQRVPFSRLPCALFTLIQHATGDSQTHKLQNRPLPRIRDQSATDGCAESDCVLLHPLRTASGLRPTRHG